MQKDIVIYKNNNDIIRIENIQNYTLYFKANKIGINTKDNEYIEFNLCDLFQVEVNIRKEKSPFILATDFILF